MSLMMKTLPFIISSLLLLVLSNAPTSVNPQRPPESIASPCPNAIRINSNYDYRRALHLICLQHDRIEVVNYRDRKTILSERLEEHGANQLASFVDDDGSLHILLAYPFKKNGTTMYTLDVNGQYLAEKHTINTQYVTAMAIWRLQLNYNWLLAIANHPTYEYLVNDQRVSNLKVASPTPMISVHSWRSTYFDSFQVINLPHTGRVNDIEPININGMEFLVIAMEPESYIDGPRVRQESADSIIYRLDFSDGDLNWMHYQFLGMKRALDVKSFVITHRQSVHQDHYIAAIGQLKSQSNNQNIDHYSIVDSSSEQYGLVIFKFIGDRYIKSDFYSVPGATKLDAISYGAGDSYVIIALLSEYTKQVTLLVYDGLTLKPLQAPQYSDMRVNPRQQMAYKARRHLGSDNLHLFLAPYPNYNQGSDTSKRDQIEAQEAFEMPVLSVSSPSHDLGQNSHQPVNQYSQSNDLYSIPINDSVFEDKSYSKRTFDNPNQGLFEWCTAVTTQLLMDNFDSATKHLQLLPRVNQPEPIELNGDLIIEDHLLVSNLLYSNRFEEINNKQLTVINEIPSNFTETFDQIRQAHRDIDGVKRMIDLILVDDGSDQDVHNPITFDTVVIECLDQAQMNQRHNVPFLTPICPYIEELNTNILNNRNITDIRTQALLTARSMTIARDVRFEHLVLKGTTEIMGYLNNITVKDIVFRRGPSTGPVIGHKQFVHGLYSASNLIVNNWNGAHVDMMNYLTSSGDQRIDAPLSIEHIILDSNQDVRNYNLSSRIETINGIHLDNHLNVIAQANSANIYQLPIEIDELVLNGPVQLSDRSFISSLDLENSWMYTMFKHSNQNITAPMEFANVHISYGGDLIVNGPINGIDFNPSLIVMKNRDYVLNNSVVFDQDLYISDLFVERELNGIQVFINPENHRYELSILYDGGNQIITGDKILTDVRLGGQSFIGGNINGRLNLTQLYHLANNNGDSYRFDTIRFAANNIRTADDVHIHIESTINGISTNQICAIANDAARLPFKTYNRLKFEDPIYFNSLRCASINGFTSLTNSFLTRSGDQRIAGTIRLTNGLVLNTTTYILSTLNDLDVRPLPSAIASVVNETITGHKTVYGDMNVDHIVAPRINNLRLADIFEARSDNPQIIRAPMTFNHLDIENVLNINGNLETSLFNLVNISDVLSNTLQYDTPQVIYNHIELNTLQVLPNSNLATKSLNGFNLRSVYADSVLKDLAQQIIGPKTFTGPLDFNEKLMSRHGIDGLSEQELRFMMLLHTDELIEGDLVFNNDVIVKKELEIQSGVINDIDLATFVDSMLYENRPDKKSFRVVGNGSLRFKDVQLNNLLVAGTIQGIDLSREALLKDNLNSTYRDRLRQQQILMNNDRLLNMIHDSGIPFRVNGNYRDTKYQGNCYVHSCDRSTSKLYSANPNFEPKSGPYYPPMPVLKPTLRPTIPYLPAPAPLIYPANQIRNDTRPMANQAPPMRPPYQTIPMPIVKQFYPNYMPPPMNSYNSTNMAQPTWRPNWESLVDANAYPIAEENEQTTKLVLDTRLLEHQARIKSQALQELSSKVNKYLSVSLFYDILSDQPILGPVLGQASNPIERDSGSPFLLLKGTSKPGEPCLDIGQTIAVLAKQRSAREVAIFTQDTLISETSNPSLVESLVVGPNNYLFVLDSYVFDASSTQSRIMVYIWDHRLGMYELKQKIPLDSQPTCMKAFSYQDRACIVTANPHTIYGNSSGLPIGYCQETPDSILNRKLPIPLTGVFELDILTSSHAPEILIAALSQKGSEQIGDLSLSYYNMQTNYIVPVSLHRLIRPLKLHWIKRPLKSINNQLVVTHAITSNDGTQASTQIFTLRFQPAIWGGPQNVTVLYETQMIRDDQFHGIQSVILNDRHSMLFLQSVHSISIYSPRMDSRSGLEGNNCDTNYEIVNRIPTKGANRFVVFNESPLAGINGTSPSNHFLVLSKDQCENQRYTTTILKSHFNSDRIYW